jgi:class 3 adenylate cyclase
VTVGAHDDEERRDAPRFRPRARTVVAAVLIGASLISMAVLVAFNLFSAQDLLNDTARDQLVEIGNARAVQIEGGVQALQDEVVTLAADRGVRTALTDLGRGFREIDERLSERQRDQVVAFYENEISQKTPPGFEEPSLVGLIPGSPRAQYLQYHYLVRNPFPEGSRSELDAAPDGSSYTRAHARHHPTLRAMLEKSASDLLLIDAASEHVVYSVEKNLEFGTGLRLGPHRDTGLARAVLGKLRTAASDEAVLVDFSSYAPAGGTPTAFVAAAIREQGRIVGALAVDVPVASLTAITTAQGQWQATGLGDTGEVYIVGSDRLMRSDARLALEDPEEYSARLADAGYPDEVGQAAEGLGTTALIQPVDTQAVRAAIAGDSFVGTSQSYLGQETLTVARPLDVPGVEWIAVAEVTTDEAYGPLRGYLWRVLIVTALVIPLVALVGVLLADRLLRPIGRIADAARRVGQGDLDVELPDTSNDEFGEMGRRFNDMVGELRGRSEALARSDEQTTELLLAALPRRVVGRVKGGEQEVFDAVRNGTIIAISIGGLTAERSAELEALRDLGVNLSARLATLADEHGVEPIHSSSSQLLYAAGLESGELEAERALAFVGAVRDEAGAFAREHVLPLEFSAGLAAGEVIAAVVGSERLAFDVWGEPARSAMTRDAVAEPGQVLVDESVAEAAGDRWPLEKIKGLVGLSGDPLDCWVLHDTPTAGAAEAASTGGNDQPRSAQ